MANEHDDNKINEEKDTEQVERESSRVAANEPEGVVPNDRPMDPADGQAATQGEVAAGYALRPKERRGFVSFLKSKLGISLASALGLIILAGILYAIPSTRYSILGTVLKKEVAVTITDQKTGKPVSKAEVVLAGQKLMSDEQGKVKFSNVPVGEYKVAVTKKYYKDAQQAAEVPVFSAPNEVALKFEATGRQVPVAVLNKISGKPLEKATISAADTTASTDQKGETVIVLPADRETVDGTVTLDDFNSKRITITVTEQKDDKNTASLTPSGKIYFLSKRTGQIDVMKSDLDGGNAEVVLKASGKEKDGDTTLLASRDWKYLVLKAKRDDEKEKEKLYIINTTNDKLSVIDEGNVSFTLVGWHNHHFIYQIERQAVKRWEPKREALKSFNADTGGLATLDETTVHKQEGDNYAYEELDEVYILDNELIYEKNWDRSGYYSGYGGAHLTIASIRPDGSNKRVVKEFDENDGTWLYAKLYKPQELYYRLIQNYLYDQSTFWEYEHGKIEEAKEVTQEKFDKSYPTFLLSPASQKTFWYESRDGKSSLFLGDAAGDNAKEVGSLKDYTPYGWFGESYLLLAKNSSELYIAPADKLAGEQSLLKVTDYHKPDRSYYGYGYGYGGL